VPHQRVALEHVFASESEAEAEAHAAALTMLPGTAGQAPA
jgi:hypothetical protein